MTRELDCATARGFVGPDAGPLHPALRAQVEAHIEACAECRAYLDLDPSLLHAYESLRQEEAPEALRNKVVGAVRALQDGQSVSAPKRESTLRSLSRSSALRYVGVLAAAGLAAVMWARDPGNQSPGFEESAYVTDFVRRATAGEHLATSDPQELARFFRDRLGVTLQPLAVDGLELESGEVCILDGELGALILYKLDGHVLSHYLVPREGTTARPPSRRVLGPDETLGMHDASEVTMVTWASDSVEQALVGSAPAEALARLVNRGAGE